MWLITTIGFFSVVIKPREDDLTVRARTRGDLEALSKLYLPTLGPIEVGTGTDYPYRARVSAQDFAGRGTADDSRRRLRQLQGRSG
jgi:hypothetical protein